MAGRLIAYAPSGWKPVPKGGQESGSLPQPPVEDKLTAVWGRRRGILLRMATESQPEAHACLAQTQTSDKYCGNPEVIC